MRPYTRKPIRLAEVSGRLTMPAKPKPKVKDEVDEEVERLKASGWIDSRYQRPADEEDGADIVAFTYTGLVFPTASKPKIQRGERDVVVVKRSKADGERRGMIFTNKRGYAE